MQAGAQSMQAAFAAAHRAHLDGRKAEAMQGYRAVLARDPAHASAAHYFGMLSLEAGLIDEAQRWVAHSLRLQPRDPDFLANAALVEQAAGRPEKAIQAYQASLTLDSQNAERWMLLGSLLLQQQHTAPARAALERALKLDPALGHGWFLLGNARLAEENRDFLGAVAALEHAHALMPTNTEVLLSLSAALAQSMQMDAARRALERAVDLDPDNARLWSNLGKYWLNCNETERSLACYEKALALQPDDVEAELALAHALQARGDFAASVACYERILHRTPGHLGALARLVDQGRFESSNAPLMVEARARADAAADTAEDKVALCFALGKAFDRLEDFDTAFAYYARGNAIKARETPFDRAAYRAWVDWRIAQFDRAYIERLHAHAHPSAKPLFIVGMPRSGTTLTETILSAHPQVVGGGEREYWPRFDPRQPAARTWWENPGDAAKMAQFYLDDLAGVVGYADARHATDKMPDNFKRVGLLHALYPNAKIVHVRRHPVDNCLSIFFQNFKGHEYSRTLEDLAFYRREYERLMAHWRQVLPADRYFEFDYEALVADQEGVTRQLLDFAGLPWDDACLQFHETKRVVKTASIWQVRQKLYSSSVERWRHYEAHIGPLLELAGTQQPV